MYYNLAQYLCRLVCAFWVATALLVPSSPAQSATWLEDGVGLRGDYFNGMDLMNPAMTRVDANIDLFWGDGSPAPIIPSDGFSVRWTGQIQPRYSEDYTFYLNTDNGRRLWIGNVLIVDKYIDDWDVEYSGKIALTAGQRYNLRMEYFENWGSASARLEWASPSQVREVVPQKVLFLPTNPPPVGVPWPTTWFKADAITNLANGARVGLWPDITGNGYHATQATISQQPLYITNAMNGQPAVRFISANSTALHFTRPVQDDFTIVCVFRSTQGFGSGTYYYQGAGLLSGEVYGVTNDFAACLFTNGQVCAGTGNPDASVLSRTGFNDGQPHVFSFTRTKSAGQVALHLDGMLAGFTWGGTAVLNAPWRLTLGAQQTEVQHLSGDIAEVQVFTNALSEAQRQETEARLAAKYGLLPPVPSDLIVHVQNQRVALNWSGSPLATHYSVKRSTVSGGPYISIATTTDRNFIDTNVVAAISYYYVVSAVNGIGESTNSLQASTAQTVYTIASGPARLSFRRNVSQYDLVLALTNGEAIYQQPSPLAVEVFRNSGRVYWLKAPYSALQDLGGGVYRCLGSTTSSNGSVFSFTDTYRAYDNSGAFQVDRSVLVSTAGANDQGFSTKLTLQQWKAGSMDDYEFFMPPFWYRNNHDVPPYALACNPGDYFYWYREDRMSLPLIMLRRKDNGASFSVVHKNPSGATFTGEDYTPRLIDSRMQFASLGMENNVQPAVGILYPGTEGERTLIGGNGSSRRWALRNHPVTANFTQSYSLVLRLTLEPSFESALQTTWTNSYTMFHPAAYSCDLSQIYADGVNILNRYWTNIHGAAGLPFAVPLNGIVTNASDYNFQMGFTGMQLCNAAILIRHGLLFSDATLRSRGEQIVDFWALNSLTASGCPRTWYNPIPQTWRTDYTFIRTATDGMLGMLWAWNRERRAGVNKAQWLTACTRFGDWLLSKQNEDGSIARAFDYRNNQWVQYSKNNTSHMIRYLAELYLATGSERFRLGALRAGNFIYTEVHQKARYVGGTADNPDVMDKEGVSMALRAFTALHDLTHEQGWLNAAVQAADHYATWIYSWHMPIPADDNNVVYPKTRQTTGLSLIAAGHSGCDSYAATDAFEIYRLYLFSGETRLLELARLMLYNTKQGLNWNVADPIPGFGDPAMLNESMTLLPPRGHGLGLYLPWQTANYMEPLINLWDTFGAYDIDSIEQQSPAERQARNNAFSANRGYAPAFSTPRVTSARNEILLTWPDWTGPFQVCMATNFATPTTWSTVTNAVQHSNGLFYLSLPLTGNGQQFFRLRAP